MRLSVCLSVRGIYPVAGQRSAMFYRNLKWGRNKNPESTNKYTKFGQLIISKIIKIIAPDVTYKGENALYSIPGVCPFVSLFICPFFVSDGVFTCCRQNDATVYCKVTATMRCKGDSASSITNLQKFMLQRVKFKAAKFTL